MPALFDSLGRFRRLIARVGQGPGEIQRTGSVIVGLGDSVWVMDGQRKHLFTPDMRYVRQDRFLAVTEIVVGDKGSIVAAGRIGSPASAGYPLHRLGRTGDVIASFGTIDPTLDPRRLAATNDRLASYLSRELTAGDASSFWAYNASRFLLERYDYQGRLLVAARHALDGWYREATDRAPSPGEFRGLRLMQVQNSTHPNLIWLVYQDRRPNFVDPGATLTMPGWAAMHDIVVEAFDTQLLQVLATRRFPQSYAIKVGNAADVLAFVQPITDVMFNYRLTTLRLLRSPSTE